MTTAIRALFALLGIALAAERAGAASIPVSFTQVIDQVVVDDDLPSLLEAPAAADETDAVSDHGILLAASGTDERSGQDVLQIGVSEELSTFDDTGLWTRDWPVP